MDGLKFHSVKNIPASFNSRIARRWLINGMGVIILVFVAIVIAFSIAIKNMYYSIARQSLYSNAEITTSVLVDDSADNVNYSEKIRSIVENYEEKNRIEIMALDYSGSVAITSQGFANEYDSAWPDYEQAMISEKGYGYFEGELDNGENVISVTVMLPAKSAEYSALRFVSSTSGIDSMINGLIWVISLICLAIVLCVAVSGMYFIKSVVLPVKKLNLAASQIAAGDYNARVIKEKEDELGELCDTINSMAEELAVSEKVKNEFISSVSHELRTPLTAIKGWGETLAMTTSQDTDTIRKGVKVIVNETGRLSEMVEELLDFSRMQNGQLAMQKSKIDILAELGEAVLVYTERAKKDGIELKYNEPVMLPPVYGDRNRLKQVFINIIDNAIKYSSAGDTVTISAVAGAEMIEINIEDTGCGINAEDIPHVKEKFYKANNLVRGSGIGLAVANEIILQHDGELVIQSTEGVGTTVTIRLPIMRENEELPEV